jgi:hypothetical protein
VIAITIANQGRLWPHYYYGPTRIEVTLASPNRPGFAARGSRLYEVTVTEGPRYPGPKRRTLTFACKFNPHRNTPRFLRDLFVRLARSDKPLPPEEET